MAPAAILDFMTVEEILEAALKLAPGDRELLIEELTASLDGSFASDEIEQAWMQEIERRSQEIDAGTAELVEWSEVRERIAQRRARRAG
jgi:putative addiction module component (TIGR02574 family)